MTRLEQEFQFRGFRVAVAQSILKGWDVVTVKEKCKIINSVRFVYATRTIKWACAEVQARALASELQTGEQRNKGLQLFLEPFNLPVPPAKKLTIPELKDRA